MDIDDIIDKVVSSDKFQEAMEAYLATGGAPEDWEILGGKIAEVVEALRHPEPTYDDWEHA